MSDLVPVPEPLQTGQWVAAVALALERDLLAGAETVAQVVSPDTHQWCVGSVENLHRPVGLQLAGTEGGMEGAAAE